MPIVVSTTTSPYGTWMPPQRKTFKVGSYYFVLYSDGTNLVYHTSLDGTTWSDATTLRTGITKGHDFSCRVYEISGVTYLYLAYTPNGGTANNPVLFRRDTISGNTITAGTEYTVFVASTSLRYMNPDVDVDTNNAVWVSFGRGDLVGLKMLALRLYYNANNDGSETWTSSTEINYGYFLGDTEDAYGGIVRLTSARMYLLAVRSGSWAKGNLRDAGAWGSIETITGALPLYAHGLASYNSNVLFAYPDTSNSIPYFFKRTYGVGWGSQETIGSATEAVHLCVDQSNGDVYAFYRAIGSIYYNKRTTTWGTETEWFSDSQIIYRSINPFWQVTDNKIGFVYMRGELSPWQIKYAVLDLAPPVVIPIGGVVQQAKLHDII